MFNTQRRDPEEERDLLYNFSEVRSGMEAASDTFYKQQSKLACISFHDLCFSATLRGRDAKVWLAGDGKSDGAVAQAGACGGVSCMKPILKGLTGVFRPGQMTAIMGVSSHQRPAAPSSWLFERLLCSCCS